MSKTIQTKEQKIFARWAQVAAEFTEGRKSFLTYARVTLKASRKLDLYPTRRQRHHEWIPLGKIMARARTISPKNIGRGLLVQDSLTQGYQRFISAGIGMANYGCGHGFITLESGLHLLHSLSARQKQLAGPAA